MVYIVCYVQSTVNITMGIDLFFSSWVLIVMDVCFVELSPCLYTHLQL